MINAAQQTETPEDNIKDQLGNTRRGKRAIRPPSYLFQFYISKN